MATVANQVHSTAQQIGVRIGWNPIDAATQPPTGTRERDPAANYCESMHEHCLDRARRTLDRGEEANRTRDLDAHRLQHGGGVRPAGLAGMR